MSLEKIKANIHTQNKYDALKRSIDAIDNPSLFRGLLSTLNFNGYCALKELLTPSSNSVPKVILEILDRVYDLYFDRDRPFKIIVAENLVYTFPDGISRIDRARTIERIVKPELYTVKYFTSTDNYYPSHPILASKISDDGHVYSFDTLGDLVISFGAYDKIVDVMVSKNYCDFIVEYI